MSKPLITIITPTTGRDSLDFLIDSIKNQNISVKHILLWNDKREGRFLFPSLQNINPVLTQALPPSSLEVEQENYTSTCVVTKGNLKTSSLKSIGLMMADTDIVTFADDNVMWEQNHLELMLSLMRPSNWAYCRRKIWSKLPNRDFEYLGVDEFESMGDEAKTEYKTIDNNCLLFNRRLGTSASVIYRETKEGNDDKLMYEFLKKHGGNFAKTLQATVNIVCEDKLVEFYRTNCTY